MKICDVYWMDDGEFPASSRVKKEKIEIPAFDTAMMNQELYEKKKNLKRQFERFQKAWEETYCALPAPQAGLIRWNRETLLEKISSGELTLPERFDKKAVENAFCAYAAVWTIGSDLEEEVRQLSDKNIFQGMFLDVAGSLYMGNVRKIIHGCAARRESAGEAAGVLAEYNPENKTGGDGILLLTRVWMQLPDTSRPKFALTDKKVFRPLKTQCALLFIGKKSACRNGELGHVPCSDCSGTKCLYRQFGGCHLYL